MSRFLRLALISGSHSINLPHLQSFTFRSSPPCSGGSPLFKSPSLLPVPFPSPSSSDSSFCGLLPIYLLQGLSLLPHHSPSTCLICNPALTWHLHPVPSSCLCSNHPPSCRYRSHSPAPATRLFVFCSPSTSSMV